MKWFAVLCFIAAGLAAFLGAGFLPVESRPPAQLTPTAPTAPRRIFAAGVVEGAQREADLQFEVGGRITAILVDEGQTVSPGDVLAQLDDVVARQKLSEAEANLELAQAERERLTHGNREETREVARAEAKLAYVKVQQADAERKRAQTMFEQKAMPEQQYDKIRFAYEAAVAEYKQAYARVTEIEAGARADDLKIADARIRLAELAVQQAQTLLDKTQLTAPSCGVVLRVAAEPGEVVALEHPRPVITMTNAEELRVRAWVEELDALSLTTGQAAMVTADGRPDVRYPGKITWVAPSMGPKQHRHHEAGEHLDVQVREVLISLEAPGELVIGLPVEVFLDRAAADVPHEDAVSAQSPPAKPAGPAGVKTPAAPGVPDVAVQGAATTAVPVWAQK